MFEIVWIDMGLANLKLVGERPASMDEAWETVLEKWGIVEHFYDDYPDSLLRCGGRFTCGFCLTRDRHNWATCIDCPIAQATGYDFCCETPYHNYIEAIDADNPWAARQAASEELEFLRSLRLQTLAQE